MESYLQHNCNFSYLNQNLRPQRNLVISATRSTPRVIYSPEKEYLMIEGKSSPENALAFYNPIIKYIYQFKKTGKTRLSVNLNFVYINTSSAKCVYNLFKVLSVLRAHRITILINWFYEDEDIMEVGKDFSKYSKLDFNLLQLELG